MVSTSSTRRFSPASTKNKLDTSRLSEDTSTDTPTGIVEVIRVADKGNSDGKLYNLNGQRVNQPTKGIYLMNGKKVIIK